MAAASPSFIDIVALDAVRERFARGEALLLLSLDLARVLWTNGPGAVLFGGSDIDALTDGPSPLGTVARRQVSSLSGFPLIGSDRPVAVRLASGMTSHILACRATAVPLADGAGAILLAAPAASAAPAETAERAIAGIAQPGQFAAIVDGRGTIVAASDGIAELQLAPRLMARLAAEAAKEPGRLVKRRIETAGRILPAGLVHLADDANLLIVVDEGFTDIHADMLSPDDAEAYEMDGGDAVSVLPAADAGPGLDIVLAEEPSETWYFNGKAADEAGDARLTEVQSGAPVRFSWRTDAGGRFTAVSPEFLDAVELTEREVVGQHWSDLASRFGFDGDSEIAGLLAGRDTWSGSTVLWPLAFSPIAVPVDLAALPTYGRSRGFEGFRGFGVARLADAVFRPEDEEAPGEPAPSDVLDEPAPPADLPEAAPEEPSAEAPAAPSLRDHSDQVVRLLSEHRFAANDRASADKPASGLSPNERNAFQEIGKRLKAAAPVLLVSAETGGTEAAAEFSPELGVSAGNAPLSDDAPPESSDPEAFAVIETFEAAAHQDPEAPGAGRPYSADPAEAASGFETSDDGASPDATAAELYAPEPVESLNPSVAEQSWSPGEADNPAREPDAAAPETAVVVEAGSELEPDSRTDVEPNEAEDEEAHPIEALTFETVPDDASWSSPLSSDPVEIHDDGTDVSTAVPPDEDDVVAGSHEPATPSVADVPPPVLEAATIDAARLWEPAETAPPETVAEQPDGNEAPASSSVSPAEDGEETAAQDHAREAEPGSLPEPWAAEPGQSAEIEDAWPAEPGEAPTSDIQGSANVEAGEDVQAGEAGPGEAAETDFLPSAATTEAWPEWRAADESEPSAVEIDWFDPAPSAEADTAHAPTDELPAMPEPDGGAALAGLPADRAVPAPHDDHPVEASDTALLDHLPIPVLIHSGDRLHYANGEFLALSGHPSLEAFEDAGGLSGLFSDAADGTAENRRLRMRSADGAEFPVETLLRTVPWKTGKALLLVLRRVEDEAPPPQGAPDGDFDAPADVPSDSSHGGPFDGAPAADGPEQRLAEMRAIVDTATDGVVLMAPDGTVRSISRPAEALFGLDSAQAAGKPFGALFAVESQRAVADYLDGLADNGVASVLNDGREVIAREAGGGFIPLFMTIGTLPAGNGFCAVLRDITQWKRAEEELTQSRALAERASSHKTEFLARVSHEIRTPLNAIIGFSELMLDEKFGAIGSDRYRDYLRDINRSGNHVLALVNDLLDISKIEAGQQDMAYEAVSLNDALGETVATMQPQANRERVIIRSSLAAQLPEVVADHRSIRQIALNILSNAIRFTPAGGQVIVSTAQEPTGDVVMRVRDTGIGMSQAEIEQALKPFKQINSLNRTRSDGTGLGLPLTKAMVEANRARFAIASTPGEGTLVEVLFPSTRVLA